MMKAYDLMKAVVENPEKYDGKRYKIVEGAAIRFNGQLCSEIVVKDGMIQPRWIKGTGCQAFVNIYCELEEIVEPVDFMTAANSGRCIKPLHPREESIRGYLSLTQWLYWFSVNGSIYNRDNALKYLNDLWLIEPYNMKETNKNM
jgi:hypothetical protein